MVRKANKKITVQNKRKVSVKAQVLRHWRQLLRGNRRANLGGLANSWTRTAL